jgi:DNA-binding response OmpR family regulator
VNESTALKGQNILIVEDRYLIACQMAEEVTRLGATVVGPSGDVAAANAAMDGVKIDLALLDVNLDGELVYPLAEALQAKGVPFLFLTGYDGELLPLAWRDSPRLTKPVNGKSLREALLRLRRN